MVEVCQHIKLFLPYLICSMCYSGSCSAFNSEVNESINEFLCAWVRGCSSSWGAPAPLQPFLGPAAASPLNSVVSPTDI